MKLATINPRMDFNIEGLLAKDIIQSRAGPSSALGFHPDMSLPYAPLHPSQPGLIQTGLPGMGTSSDALRRTISSHLTAMSGGYKEPTSQAPNVWEDELHNIVQMGLNSSISLDGQDLDDNYVSLAFLQDRIFFLLLLYGPLPWVPDYSIFQTQVAKIKSDEREDLKVLATGVAAALTARKASWITEKEFGMGHLDLKHVPSVSSKSLSGNIAPSQNGSDCICNLSIVNMESFDPRLFCTCLGSSLILWIVWFILWIEK